MTITVTISAPNEADVDENFNISGIAYEDGEPLSYVTVHLYYNGSDLGSTQAGVDGDYLKSVSIGESGNWTLKAEVDIDGSGYGTRPITIIPPVPDPPTSVVASSGTFTNRVWISWVKSDGATGYQVYRDGVGLGWIGDVATEDDYGADAAYITPGTANATDGVFTDQVSMILQGTQFNSGTSHTYKVKAKNDWGESGYSGTNNGYRGYGTPTYQWYRSSGDADIGYASIDGATSSTYNDTGAPAPTITPGTAAASDGAYIPHVHLILSGEDTTVGDGRYYKCRLSATGCYIVWSGSNRGYRGGGALGLQWQRSAGDSDASYSNIGGATTDPYDDTGAPVNGDGRYYRCYLTATGAVSQYSSTDRGYRAAPETMIGGPTSWDWGIPEKSVSTVRITSDGGLTSIWGLAVGTITIPSGGPLGWEWKEVEF